jgi:2-polyprenyl-6-methoxyphenol hydroxylase-like FAD-dependent oxidoreductase
VWETDPRVTLMEDAIHHMSPTGGVGVVTAIRDAATLAALLAENGPTKENIATYERGMRETAEMSIRRSVAGGKVLFGQGPLEEAKAVDVWASN